MMRAKMIVDSVVAYGTMETLKMRAVSKSDGYSDDGKDENNTYSTFSPSATLELSVTNPDLIGRIKAQQQFYVDFSEVPEDKR